MGMFGQARAFAGISGCYPIQVSHKEAYVAR